MVLVEREIDGYVASIFSDLLMTSRSMKKNSSGYTSVTNAMYLMSVSDR